MLIIESFKKINYFYVDIVVIAWFYVEYIFHRRLNDNV
jgi:hypothetical protein